ncbi:hypothetical protein ACLI4Z_18045 [Natrialbaceae archaeon A-arb3/5]
MTRKFFLLLVCVAAALVLLGTPAAAQDDAVNETEMEQNSDRFADIDGNAYVEDWSYSSGSYHVSLNSTQPTTAHLMPPLDSADEGSGSLDVATVDLEGNETREITVQGDGELTIVTDTFLETGDHVRLSSGSQALIGPPYSPTDIWIAAGTVSLSIGAVVVIRVVSHLLGIGRTTERVA